MRFFMLLPIVCGLDLEATYSAFSGLVAEVQVGTPPTSIRVSLDFSNQAETYLFNGEFDCPPFVGDCYNPIDRLDSHADCSESLPQYLRDWGVCRTITDNFISGSDIFAVKIDVLSKCVPSSVRFREVAGIVGLNKLAPLLSLRKRSDGIPGVVVSSDISDVIPSLSFVDSKFKANVFFCEGECMFGESIDVRFDPNVQIMSVPADLLIRGQRSLLPCNTPRLSMAIHITGGGVINIPSSLLLDWDEIDPETYQLAIAAYSGSELVIGRQLIEAVESVVIDGREGKIGFEIASNFPLVVPPYFGALRMPLIPVFSSQIRIGEDGGLEVPVVVGSDGFVLVSDQPSVVSLDAFSVDVESFRFIPTSDGLDSFEAFEGMWALTGTSWYDRSATVLRFPVTLDESAHVVSRHTMDGGFKLDFTRISEH